MNERIFESQAELCRVFTHPLRIQVLELIGKGERSVSELAEACGVAQPTLSQHLSILRQRGVAETRREGQTIYYRLADARILEACHLMREVLLERYRDLASQARQAESRPAKRGSQGRVR